MACYYGNTPLAPILAADFEVVKRIKILFVDKFLFLFICRSC